MARTAKLTDREVATTLDALAQTRDRLREAGLTGNECQAAFDKIAGLLEPRTNGLTLIAED